MSPEPDALGRFDEAGVKWLAERRGCELIGVEKLSALIRIADDPEAQPEYAIWGDEGRWYPIEVYRACTRARGEKVHPFETPKGVMLPATGIDHERVAELIAADGVRVWYGRAWTIAFEAVLRTTRDGIVLFGDRRPVKKAVLAVADAGLAELTLGPRDGWVRATLTWHDRARLRTPEEIAEESASRRDADDHLHKIF